MQGRPLLTIAIPTYNRARFLNQCLKCITDQVDTADDRVEILVSDNCSPDDTREVVAKYIDSGAKIRYIVNSENMGGDFNVAQCYKEAKGQYVVAFGDDDQLLAGSVDLILKTIQENRGCGVIHLNAFDQKHVEGASAVFESPIDFLREISYFATFISANLINRDLIDFSTLLKYKDSCLNHVNLILEASLQAQKNIFIQQKSVVGAGIENSQGYDVYQVFGVNFNEIIKAVEARHGIPGLRREINNQLLIHFFPAVILIQRRSGRQFEGKKAYLILSPVYKKYPYYWLFCVPMLFLPRPLVTKNTYGGMKEVLYKLLQIKGVVNRLARSRRQAA
jgi:abequosyltransferase